MTPSYLGRLLLLSSASFFLVQIAAALLVSAIAPAAIRRAAVMRPSRGARYLLTLRLLPAIFSAAVVAALCVPSYLRFEPRVAEEEVGFVCLVIAILGAALCTAAILRAVRALVRSSRFVRDCGGRQETVEGETVWIVRRSAGLALAGILHPRLLISESALRELSREQMAVALRHEGAHRGSRDNFKRLLMLLAPAIFPRVRLLEQAWAQCAEWAADDEAAYGDAERSALAATLVQVARLQAGISMPPLVTSLVEAGEELSLRVDRLLEAPVYEAKRRLGAIALTASAVLICAMAMNPASQRVVHEMLERLLD
jgi:beta-lactamase regulating signal transducer with metallopeptidase domain